MGTSGTGEKGNAIIDLNGVSEQESEDSNTMSAWKAYWRVFTYAGPMEYVMLAVACVAAVASGVGIASQNIIFGQFVTAFTDFGSDKAGAANFRNSGAKLALYFFYLGVGRLVVAYVYNSLLTYSAYRIVRNIRHDYLRSALRQEIAYFDFGTSGSIATKAYSNGRLVQNGISEKLGLTIQGLSAFLSSFIIAFITNWKLTLIICAIAPLTVIVMAVCAFIQAGYETKSLDCYAGANAFAEGVIASIRTVHAFEMRSRLVDKFDQFLKEAHFWGNKMSVLFGILFSAEYTIIYCGNALAFWRGIHMLASGEIANTGDVFTVLLSVVIAALSITQLAPYSIEFTRAASAAAQLFVLIDRQTEIDPFNPSGEQPPSLEGDVELEGITFAYPTRPNTIVLDDFTLKAPAGKVTALVGHSGSGKSTIVGLIERWYNPASGVIKLDGRPIDSLNISWLRRNIRLVQQEPVLFRGSVFDNIVHGLVGTPLEKASREEQMKHVVEAAKIAYADDFISQLPNGYDTDIGQRGGLLSGGQKQRVAIARSLVSNPKVLLLDEATSALDPYAESVVQEALERASEGRTTIVIAHKLATIRKADNIVVMSAGKIIEQGTHESLISMEGAYARLVAVQNLHVSNDNSPEDSDVEASSMEGDSRLQTSKSLTRYPTADQGSIDIQPDFDQYDDENSKQLSLLGVVWRLIIDNPDMKWAYLAIFWGCFFSAGLFPGQAILMANMVDVFTLTGSEMIKRGDFFAAMFVILAGGALLSYYVMGWGTNTLAQTLAHNLRKQIFNDILRQDLEYFDRPENSTGALASRVDSYPQAVFELMGFNIGFILIAAINILACSLLGIIFAWKLGLVIVFGGSTAVVGFGFAKMFFDGRLDRAVTKRLSTSSAIASESTNAIRTVSSLGIEGSILNSYLYELDTAITKSVKPLLNMMIWFALSQCSEFWFMALGFWYGSRLVSFGEITLFEFFVSFMSVFFCAQATSQIFQFSTSITKGKNGANAMFWLQQLQPTVRETPENKDNGPKSGGPVALEDVKFAYPLRPDTRVLKGIDLEIMKGQFVALVGASGCGKSTIVSMLERFYDPTKGCIRIAGDDLTTLNPRKYRSEVGLVQQEPTLFQGTIRENIALGVDDPTTSNGLLEKMIVPDADIEAALRSANAWDFVSSLPEGLSTAAGPNGTQLSGGQRQRIAIARALVRNPRILLLDEATSALDTESEKIVQNALSEAAKEGDRITIAVAHRLSTIKDADKICVFYGGRIVEQGTHAELLNGNGNLYRKMCEAQSLA